MRMCSSLAWKQFLSTFTFHEEVGEKRFARYTSKFWYLYIFYYNVQCIELWVSYNFNGESLWNTQLHIRETEIQKLERTSD